MRNFFNFLLRQHFFFLFLILEVMSFILIVQNNYYQRSSFINTTNNVSGNILTSISNINQYFSLSETNRSISEENARLLTESKKYYSKVDNRIYFYDDTIFKQQYEFASAKIIRNSTTKRNNFLTLDKGSTQGIEPGMGVMTSNGVVGIVKEVSPNFSSVISVLNKESKICAKVKKDGQIGTVTWKGGDYRFGQLIDIPTHVKLKPGDTIITSGFSNSFPEGIMIGTIVNYRIEKGDNFYTITIKFSTDFNSISYAYIVKNIMKNELDKLNKNNPYD